MRHGEQPCSQPGVDRYTALAKPTQPLCSFFVLYQSGLVFASQSAAFA